MSDSRLNAPNALSAFRIACVPLLLWIAWRGNVGAFVAVFALGLVTDVLDGIVARRFGLATEFGARLDQWGDFALWLSLPLAAWWLWPEILLREWPYIATALVCMVAPTGLAFAKYREVPGYHTWSVKLGSVLMAVSIPLLLLFDVAWPFRLAALWQVVCAIDELGITLLFAECRHDVPSLAHAFRLRRS